MKLQIQRGLIQVGEQMNAPAQANVLSITIAIRAGKSTHRIMIIVERQAQLLQMVLVQRSLGDPRINLGIRLQARQIRARVDG